MVIFEKGRKKKEEEDDLSSTTGGRTSRTSPGKKKRKNPPKHCERRFASLPPPKLADAVRSSQRGRSRFRGRTPRIVVSRVVLAESVIDGASETKKTKDRRNQKWREKDGEMDGSPGAPKEKGIGGSCQNGDPGRRRRKERWVTRKGKSRRISIGEKNQVANPERGPTIWDMFSFSSLASLAGTRPSRNVRFGKEDWEWPPNKRSRNGKEKKDYL